MPGSSARKVSTSRGLRAEEALLEGHQAQAPKDAFVGPSDVRAVVGDEYDLELRAVPERPAVGMAGSDRVAAGHVLDDSLVEALSRTALNGGDDAHAEASGKVVLGGPAEASGQEGVEAGLAA